MGLLHQLPFRANAVEDLQQYGTQEFLRGNAGTTAFDIRRIHAGEQGFDGLQGLIHHRPDRTQWMLRRYKIVQATHREQTLGEGIGSAHDQLRTLGYLGESL